MTRPRSLVAAIITAATVVVSVAPASGQSPSASPAGIVSVSDGPGFADSFAYGVATASDGSIVVVGQHLDKDPAVPPGAAAWHSLDGSAWTEVALPQPRHATSLDVAVSPLGWVAIGFVPDGVSLLWTSTDGRSWTRAKALKGGQPQVIIATADGFLVGGQSVVKGVARPVAWHTTDLVSWTRIKLPGKGRVSRLAQLSSGVTLALVANVASNQLAYRYLRSVDGSTWDNVDFPVVRAGTDVLSAAELGTTGELFIQVVDTGPAAGPFVGSVWTSPDGLAWRHAWSASGPLFAVASGTLVNVFGKGLQVSSADGAVWTETDRPEIQLTSGATALSDGRTLVLDNTNVDPPSVVVQLVPAPAIAASPVPSVAPPAASASAAAPEPTASALPNGSPRP